MPWEWIGTPPDMSKWGNTIVEIRGYWKCDNVFTVKRVELPTKYTKNGVAILEADGVEFRVDCGPLYEVSNN